MLFAEQFIYRQNIPFTEWWQFAALLFLGIIHVFHVNADEAGKNQHLSVGSEQCIVTA